MNKLIRAISCLAASALLFSGCGRRDTSPRPGPEEAVCCFTGETDVDGRTQPFEVTYFRTAARKNCLELRVLGDALRYELRDDWMPETVEAPRTADLDRDGSDDILVDLGIYGKIRFVVCYIYDAETGGYRMLEGFDELENPRFDEVRGCVFDWCHLSAPEYMIHRYIVDGDRLTEVGSLYWNYNIVPGGPRYTERELRDGEMVTVKENVPEREIDLSRWTPVTVGEEPPPEEEETADPDTMREAGI